MHPSPILHHYCCPSVVQQSRSAASASMLFLPHFLTVTTINLLKIVNHLKSDSAGLCSILRQLIASTECFMNTFSHSAGTICSQMFSHGFPQQLRIVSCCDPCQAKGPVFADNLLSHVMEAVPHHCERSTWHKFTLHATVIHKTPCLSRSTTRKISSHLYTAHWHFTSQHARKHSDVLRWCSARLSSV